MIDSSNASPVAPRVVRHGPGVPLRVQPTAPGHACHFVDDRCLCGRVARMDGTARTSPADALGARSQMAEIASRRIVP